MICLWMCLQACANEMRITMYFLMHIQRGVGRKGVYAVHLVMVCYNGEELKNLGPQRRKKHTDKLPSFLRNVVTHFLIEWWQCCFFVVFLSSKSTFKKILLIAYLWSLIGWDHIWRENKIISERTHGLWTVTCPKAHRVLFVALSSTLFTLQNFTRKVLAQDH